MLPISTRVSSFSDKISAIQFANAFWTEGKLNSRIRDAYTAMMPNITPRNILSKRLIGVWWYYFILRLKSTILMAVTAHSSPLFPNLPPQRSFACCMSLVVIRP